MLFPSLISFKNLQKCHFFLWSLWHSNLKLHLPLTMVKVRTLLSFPMTLFPSNMWKWKSEREVTQSCLTLQPPSTVEPTLKIFQARVLEWDAISFSSGSSRPSKWTQVSGIVGRRFTIWATREFTYLCLLFFMSSQNYNLSCNGQGSLFSLLTY